MPKILENNFKGPVFTRGPPPPSSQHQQPLLTGGGRGGGEVIRGVQPVRFCQKDYRPQKHLHALGTLTITISLTNLKSAYLNKNAYRPHKRLPAFAMLTSTRTLTNLKNAYLLTKLPLAKDHSNAKISISFPQK